MNYLRPEMNISLPDSHMRRSDYQSRQLFARSPIVLPNGATLCTTSTRKKRKPWSKEEDTVLLESVKKECSSKVNWTDVAERLNEQSLTSPRTGKQCRERWQNHLRPNIKKGDWSEEEERMIQDLYECFGPKWSSMSKLLADRTDNDIKNKWNSMQRTQKALKAKKELKARCERKRQQEIMPGTLSDDTIMILSQVASEDWDCNHVQSRQV